MKNLVIGSGSGYSWYIWEPFIRSFVKNISNADLVLLVDNNSDFTLHKLEQVGKEIKGGELKLVPFPKELQGHPANTRWKATADYIEEHCSEYEQIFSTDTRDVIFQENLFDCYKNYSNYLACAEEDFAGYIGTDDGVCNWIKNAYGETELEKMSDKFMYCPSTVAGTSEEMKIFSRKMWEHMPKNKDFYGLDLATECYIMYNNLVPVKNIFEVRCHDGEILSSFWFHVMNPIEFDGEKILRGDGKIPAVVHQYDRHEKLVALVDKIYREPISQPNENFSDLRSNIEQFFHLVRSENLEGTLKFFTDSLMEKTNFEGYGNYLIDAWKVLLKRKNISSASELLEIALQRKIISALKEKFFVNHGKLLCQCMDYCKKNNRTIIAELENFVRNKIIQAVKFHLEKKNSDRYFRCLNVMARAGLTSHEYFYLLKAEINLMLRHKEFALENYRDAFKSKNNFEDEEEALKIYKAQMRENLPEEIRR